MKRLWMVLLVLGASVVPAGAQSFLAWRNLVPGRFDAGFRSEVLKDQTRTIQSPMDAAGRPHPAYGARPIQVAMWYPAEGARGVSRMAFGDYLSLLGWPVGADAKGAAERAALELRYIQAVTPSAGPPDAAAFERLRAATVFARKDAVPARGKFPVVIYAPGSGYPSFDNSVLCEYLASHGFVVLAAPSAGADARRLAGDLASVEAQTRDLEFLIGYAQGLPQADGDRLAVAGFSGGGVPSVLCAIRNRRVRALVSLDGTIEYGPELNIATAHPDLDPLRLRIPMLLVDRPAEGRRSGFGERSFTDMVKYADVTRATVSGLEHHDMASMSSLFRRTATPGLSRDWEPETKAYQEVTALVLRFLTEALSAPGVPARLRTPESAGTLTVSIRRALPAPPDRADLLDALESGGIERAAELLRAARARSAEAAAPLEEAVNEAAYERLMLDQDEAAIRLFVLNAEVFPGSVNAHDSLGEACLKVGDLDRAERSYREALRVLQETAGTPAARVERYSAGIRKALDEIAKRRAR